MKYLILLLLLGACSEKPLTAEEQETARKNLAFRNQAISNFYNPPPKVKVKLDLKYHLKPTIYLLTLDDAEQREEPPYQYMGFYYEPESRQYYYAFFQETNGLPITIEDIRLEPIFFDDTNILFYDNLKYVGNLSLLERLYINPKTGQQYYQTLTPIADTNYVDQTEYKSHTLEDPVYPKCGTNFYTSFQEVYYTNKKGGSYLRAINPSLYFPPNEPIPPYLQKGTLID